MTLSDGVGKSSSGALAPRRVHRHTCEGSSPSTSTSSQHRSSSVPSRDTLLTEKSDGSIRSSFLDSGPIEKSGVSILGNGSIDPVPDQDIPKPNKSRSLSSKPGTLKQHSALLRRIADVYRVEQKVYQKAANDNARHAPKTHIWEIFAGTAQITRQALAMGLSAYQPIDSRYGQTLTKTSTREILEVLRPPRGVLLACLEFPCALWSVLN